MCPSLEKLPPAPRKDTAPIPPRQTDDDADSNANIYPRRNREGDRPPRRGRTYNTWRICLEWILPHCNFVRRDMVPLVILITREKLRETPRETTRDRVIHGFTNGFTYSLTIDSIHIVESADVRAVLPSLISLRRFLNCQSRALQSNHDTPGPMISSGKARESKP